MPSTALWMVMRSFQRGRSRLIVIRNPSRRSTTEVVPSSTRENVRRSFTMVAVRSAPLAITPRICAMSSQMASVRLSVARLASNRIAVSCSRSGAMLPTMKVSGLLSSWATPATSWPSEAIFSDWMSCPCVSCRRM